MEKDYSSEDLSAEVLKYLKSKVQNDDFKSVVITIPAMFNDSQKTATKNAASKAGFTQVELLQEPIAAASAYGLDEKTQDGKILIFDSPKFLIVNVLGNSLDTAFSLSDFINNSETDTKALFSNFI